MPQVSIVLPVYNGEKYLHQSIDSILAQTLTDWELIIVDDCSIDRTSEIIKTYVNMDSRIRVYRNETNQKLPRSLNNGFEHAAGKYLTWTSDDNLYLPTAIAEMTDYLDNNVDAAMVVADMCIFDDDTSDECILSFDEKEVYVHNCVGACFLYRSDVIDIIGGYNPDWFLVEDYDYWLRILFECGSIGHVDKCLYRYRIHRSSLTITRKKDVQSQLIQLLTTYIDQIVDRLSNNIEWLVCLYYELIQMGTVGDELESILRNYLPQVSKDIIYDDNKCYVIYGAGQFGEKAVEKLGERAVAFVDGNPEFVGKKKCGLNIYSVDNVLEIAKNNHVMIAADARKLYGMISRLEKEGVDDFCTWINYNNFQYKNLLRIYEK